MPNQLSPCGSVHPRAAPGSFRAPTAGALPHRGGWRSRRSGSRRPGSSLRAPGRSAPCASLAGPDPRLRQHGARWRRADRWGGSFACHVAAPGGRAPAEPRSAAVEDFLEWCGQQGIRFPALDAACFDGLWGMVATRDIAEGDLLVHLPQAAVLSTSTEDGDACPCGGFVTQEAWDALEDLAEVGARLALRLLQAASEPSSALRPYLALLPEEYFSLATFSDAELAELQYPPVLEAAQAEREFVAAAWEALVEHSPGTPVTQGELAWAMQTVASRHFMGAGAGHALLPGVDLINHRPGPASEPEVDHALACFLLRADRPFAKGDQVFISYGEMGNDELALLFGFVEAHNPYDSYEFGDFFGLLVETYPSAAGFDPDKAYDRMLQWNLTFDDLEGVTLDAEGGVDEEVAACMRAMCTGEEVLQHIPPEEHAQVADKWLRSVCEAELRRMPTTLEADEMLLEDMAPAEDARLRLAIQFRIEKKRLLMRAISRLS